MASQPSTSDSLAVCELVPLRTRVCLPGDVVLAVGRDATVFVGGGLRPLTAGSPSPSSVYMLAEVCAPVEKTPVLGRAGLVRYSAESPAARRYTYALGDPVVAVVARKVSSQFYYCHTGGPALASLDALAFDGATKSSRPRLVEGDVLFAYVKSTGATTLADGVHRETASHAMNSLAAASGEPEISCMAAEAGLAPKDWTSGDSVFGPLTGGRVLTVPLPYARSLLTLHEEEGGKYGAQGEAATVPASYLLARMGTRVPFDICVGMNGMVWVRGHGSELDPAAAVRRTVAVCACLTEAQYDATREEMDARVASYFPK